MDELGDIKVKYVSSAGLLEKAGLQEPNKTVWSSVESSDDQDNQDQESISSKHMICVIGCLGGEVGWG